MTPIERTIAVLNRWCGENAVDDTDETLEDLWNRTKPTGKPSHSAIDFYQPGSEDLINRLIAEFNNPPKFKVNITYKDLKPGTGAIKTVKDLLKAVSQFDEADSAPVAIQLTAGAHEALVSDIVARLEPQFAKLGGGTLLPPVSRDTTAAKKVGAKKLTAKKRSPRRRAGEKK
jgi:hypothetical protein